MDVRKDSQASRGNKSPRKNSLPHATPLRVEPLCPLHLADMRKGTTPSSPPNFTSRLQSSGEIMAHTSSRHANLPHAPASMFLGAHRTCSGGDHGVARPHGRLPGVQQKNMGLPSTSPDRCRSCCVVQPHALMHSHQQGALVGSCHVRSVYAIVMQTSCSLGVGSLACAESFAHQPTHTCGISPHCAACQL